MFLVFLATGDSFKTLAGHFHLGVSTVHQIIKNTCDTIWMKLKNMHMKTTRSKRLGAY